MKLILIMERGRGESVVYDIMCCRCVVVVLSAK